MLTSPASRQARLRLHSQAIVELRSNRAVSEELLVRLQHVGGRLVGPASFLGDAERTGWINVVDRWVVDRAAELVAEGRSVHVNVSGVTVGDHSFPDFVERTFSTADADPAKVVFELTETTRVPDMEQARRFAQHVTALGSRLALDDFGSGYACLSYLKNLPVSLIKIDREFVLASRLCERSRAVIAATVDLAGTLGIATVAEGVEDPVTLELMRDMGVGYAQGYELALPGPVD